MLSLLFILSTFTQPLGVKWTLAVKNIPFISVLTRENEYSQPSELLTLCDRTIYPNSYKEARILDSLNTFVRAFTSSWAYFSEFPATWRKYILFKVHVALPYLFH